MLKDLVVHGKFLKMEIVPMQMRVYRSCSHPVAGMILVIVDNNGIRHNCDELVQEFEKSVKEDGRINLQREGELDWFLSVRYTYDKITGAIGCSHETYIDRLLVKYGMEHANTCKLPINPGSDLESLPIFDTPDKIVVRAYAALIGELLYIAINTVPQLSYSMTVLLFTCPRPRRHFSPTLRCCCVILLASRKDSSCIVDNEYALFRNSFRTD